MAGRRVGAGAAGAGDHRAGGGGVRLDPPAHHGRRGGPLRRAALPLGLHLPLRLHLARTPPTPSGPAGPPPAPGPGLRCAPRPDAAQQPSHIKVAWGAGARGCR